MEEKQDKPVRNAYRQGKSGLTVYFTPEQRKALGVAAALAGLRIGEFVTQSALLATTAEKKKHGLD